MLRTKSIKRIIKNIQTTLPLLSSLFFLSQSYLLQLPLINRLLQSFSICSLIISLLFVEDKHLCTQMPEPLRNFFLSSWIEETYCLILSFFWFITADYLVRGFNLDASYWYYFSLSVAIINSLTWSFLFCCLMFISDHSYL